MDDAGVVGVAGVDSVAAWALPLLRCPYCMSGLALTPDARLRCNGCGREYDLHRSNGATAIPRLRRGDGLATLAQDIVVFYEDPDSTRLDRRARIARFERRERFLSALLRRVPEPYAILAAQPERPVPPPTPEVERVFDRFVALVPAHSTVLDLACGRGVWTARLAARGLRVLAADGSLPSLEWVVAPHPPAPSPSEGEREMLPSVAGVEADVMEMPFAATSMDGVWCSEAFEYVRPDRRVVFFRQVHRVLKPGGVLYLSAETTALRRIVRQHLLWRYLFHKPVVFWEYIYRLPPAHGGGWHYHAMTSRRTLLDLCRDHGFTVLSLRREGLLWLLLARKTR